jgi:MFS family permease
MPARGTLKGVILVLAQALPIMAVVSLFPVIPQLMQQFGGVPHGAFLVPMIITLPSFGIALFSPLAGWLADRLGRRPVMVGALALYAATGLLPLILSDLTAIVLSRAVLGLAEAGIVTVASTLIADYFGDQRYRWLAIQSGLGSALGTLLIALGGWLAESSWRGPFSVYAVTIPLLVLAALFIDEPAAQRQTPATPLRRGAFPWRIAAIIGVVSLLSSALYYVEPTNVATLFMQRGASSSSQIGLIQALTSLGYILGAFVYKRLSQRGIGLLLALAGVLVGVGMLGIGVSHSLLAAALWAVPQQLGGGMVIPALTAWAQGSMPFDQRGRAMGIWATFFFAGLFLCPTLVTLTTAALGSLSGAFAVLGAVCCALAVLSFLCARRAPLAASTL